MPRHSHEEYSAFFLPVTGPSPVSTVSEHGSPRAGAGATTTKNARKANTQEFIRGFAQTVMAYSLLEIHSLSIVALLEHR
jgi:hypothetical protein